MSDWNTSDGWSNGANGALNGATAGFSVGGPIGAVVGGVAGGLTGLFGTKKKTDWNKKTFRESVRQFNVQDEYNKNRLQYIVKDANKAGINVEAALGAGAGHYSPTISAGGYGSDSGSSDSGVGGFMRRAADTITSMKQAKQDRAIALESANLDLEGKRLQNDILRQKLMTEVQPGTVRGSVSNPLNDKWRIPMDYGLRDAKPLYKSWINDSGDVVRLIDPDAIADADYSNTEAIRAYGSSARSFLTDETPLGNIRRWLNRRSRSTGKTWLYGKPKGY